MLSARYLETLIYALMFSCLSYCNAVLSCLIKATCYNSCKTEQPYSPRHRPHITLTLVSPTLASHEVQNWLHDIVIAYKALRGLAPLCISELLYPYSTAQPLRSTEQGLLILPCSLRKNKGDCAFYFANIFTDLLSDDRTSNCCLYQFLCVVS